MATNVSIVLVHYKQKENLKEVLESIKKQTYKKFELILCEDGSNDLDDIDFNEYDFPVIKCWQQDKAMRLARNRNNGIKLARGEWIWFLEGDMVARPEILEVYTDYADKEKVLIGGRTDKVGGKGHLEGELSHDQVPGCNFFLYKDQIIKAGMWNEDCVGYGYDDYEAMLRMKKRCKVQLIGLPEAACYHIPHEQKWPSAINEAVYNKAKKDYESL